jgi:hypothetical protein
MEQKQYRKARSKKEWKALVKEYRESGLNKTEFCRKKEISRATLHIWNEALVEEEEVGKFIPLSVCGTEAAIKEKLTKEIRSRVSIEVENGLKVEFKHGCKVSEIQAIANILAC